MPEMLSVARDARAHGDDEMATGGTMAGAWPPRPTPHGPCPPGSARRELHQYAAAQGNSRFVVELCWDRPIEQAGACQMQAPCGFSVSRRPDGA